MIRQLGGNTTTTYTTLFILEGEGESLYFLVSYHDRVVFYCVAKVQAITFFLLWVYHGLRLAE